MRIAVTGATGFVGRYIVRELARQGHHLRCWLRPTSDHGDHGGMEDVASRIEWQPGQLGDVAASRALVTGCDAVVHAALHHPGGGFRGGEGELVSFVETNVVGTLQLVEAAIRADAGRFVFISTCAVHEKILDDRPLDETHPLWPTSHYGAHKAAIEKFIHSYGLGMDYPICALRPTGVYGLAHPVEESKWFELVRAVTEGRDVTCRRGGKEVHAVDVARAVRLLLEAPRELVTGEAFNCYDLYISEWDVAHVAKRLSGSTSKIHGQQTRPKHQIVTEKIVRLGMQFGGQAQLERTVGEMIEAVQNRTR